MKILCRAHMRQDSFLHVHLIQHTENVEGTKVCPLSCITSILELGTQWHKNPRSDGVESFCMSGQVLKIQVFWDVMPHWLVNSYMFTNQFTNCHSIISQKIWIFTNTVLRNSNLAMGKNSHKFMTESGKPRRTRAQILIKVYKYNS